jgi:hypothetical protein
MAKRTTIKPLITPDPRQPYLVHARNRDGHVRPMGRSATSDGGLLVKILERDGFEVTKVTKARA